MHRVPGNAIYRMDGLDERTLYGISASKTNLENEAFVTLGFRLHVVVLNDPVRRSVVHLCYSWLGAGWAVSMVGYLSTEFDPTDPVFNPMWRREILVMLFMARLGVMSSR